MKAAVFLLAALLALPGPAGEPPPDPSRMEDVLAWINQTEQTEPERTLKASLEELQVARRKGDPAMEVAFLTCVAYASSQTGDFDQAVKYAQDALDLATRLGNRERVAKAHNILGITYTYMGWYGKALDEGLTALRLREDLGLEGGVLQSLNLIGVIYHRSGQYEKAIEAYRQILGRLASRPQDPRIILSNLNIGFSLFKMGRYREALDHHLKALDLSRRTPDQPYLPYAFVNLGMTYTELGDYAQASSYLGKGLEEYARHDAKHGRVQVLNALARLDLLTRRYDDGIRNALEAADLAGQIKARDDLKTSYALLSGLCEKQGRLALALDYYKRFSDTKDAIFTDQESERIANLSMDLVNLKKDREIASLKQERVIASLTLQKHRYVTVLLISGVAGLLLFLLLLLRNQRRARRGKGLLEAANRQLHALNRELQVKIGEVKTLSGLVPICANCKKIRDDDGYWQQLEGYISKHTSATFSHGICPHCAEELFPEVMEARKDRGGDLE